MSNKLYEYLSPESKVKYFEWKKKVEKDMIINPRLGVYPTFWLDFHLDFLNFQII